jgi:hypothetical protein
MGVDGGDRFINTDGLGEDCDHPKVEQLKGVKDGIAQRSFQS